MDKAENIDEKAALLKARVNAMMTIWRLDAGEFCIQFPNMECHRNEGDQLEAIAHDVFAGSGFEWSVVRIINGEAFVAVGLYDEREVWER